jgi:uncharacterized membrane protein YdbT with pleckstrin-like domain
MFLPGLEAEITAGRPRAKTAPRAFFRLVWRSVFVIVGLVTIFAMLGVFLPSFSKLYLFLLIMTEIPAFMYLAACIVEYKNSGIAHNNDRRHYISYCRKRFSQHMVIIPENKVCTLRTSQTVFQRRNRTADLTIITCGERGAKYKVRSVKTSDFDII